MYAASERPCWKEFLLVLSLPSVHTPSPRSGLQEKAILNVKQPQILQTVKNSWQRTNSKMMGPGQTTALNWEEASWCLLRIGLQGKGSSTPPSLGEILLQDFFVVWRGASFWLRCRQEALGQAPQERGRPRTSVVECLHAPYLNPEGHSFIHSGSTHLWMLAVLYSYPRGLNKMLTRPQGSHVTLSRDFSQPRHPGLPPASSHNS